MKSSFMRFLRIFGCLFLCWVIWKSCGHTKQSCPRLDLQNCTFYLSLSLYNVLHSDTATGEEGGKREAPKPPDRLMPHLRWCQEDKQSLDKNLSFPHLAQGTLCLFFVQHCNGGHTAGPCVQLAASVAGSWLLPHTHHLTPHGLVSPRKSDLYSWHVFLPVSLLKLLCH